MKNDSTNKIKIQPVKKVNISDYQQVIARIQGEMFADFTASRFEPKINIKRLDKNRYLVLSDGEIKEYKKRDGKMRFESNLRRTFDYIRWTIRHNFTGGENELFGTLTYAENMCDKDRLREDFEYFMKKLRRKYPGHKYEYIAVDEPQARGAWHVHFLLKSDKPVLFIENDRLAKIWGHGYTKIKRLKGITDIGTYFVSYFTDIIVNDDGTEATEEQINAMSEMVRSKKRKKAERLKYYPPNAKFYHTSRGIQPPPPLETTYGELKQEYGEPKYIAQYDVVEETLTEARVLNRVTRGSFKKTSAGEGRQSKKQVKQIISSKIGQLAET